MFFAQWSWRAPMITNGKSFSLYLCQTYRQIGNLALVTADRADFAPSNASFSGGDICERGRAEPSRAESSGRDVSSSVRVQRGFINDHCPRCPPRRWRNWFGNQRTSAAHQYHRRSVVSVRAKSLSPDRYVMPVIYVTLLIHAFIHSINHLYCTHKAE